MSKNESQPIESLRSGVNQDDPWIKMSELRPPVGFAADESTQFTALLIALATHADRIATALEQLVMAEQLRTVAHAAEVADQRGVPLAERWRLGKPDESR